MSHRSVMARIKTTFPTLSTKEKQVARYILDNPRDASRCTITELASELGVADSTIFKFCKKFGYSGFRAFRNDLLSEEYDPEISIHEKISASDDVYEVAQKVFQSSIQSLTDTISMIDQDTLQTAVDLVMNANSISFFGCGGSNIVAFDAYQKFLRTPFRVQHCVDQDVQMMQAAQLKRGDVAIIISHSGLSKRTLDLAQVAKSNGAWIIAITSYTKQRLSELADVTLISASEETGYRSESLSTRIAQLALIDSLFTAVSFRKQGVNASLHKMRTAINLTKLDN